jgi:topoisomerase IA-like protein
MALELLAEKEGKGQAKASRPAAAKRAKKAEAAPQKQQSHPTLLEAVSKARA